MSRTLPARVLAWPALVLASLAVALCAHAAPVDPSGFLPVDAITPGMKGVARTVFRGTEVEEFPVEIVSVLRGRQPKGDQILFRALDERVAYTGIVAGMSGSPVTIDGKLVGAIAAAYPFSKDPIGFITPIGEMVEGLERADDKPGTWMGFPAERFEELKDAFLASRADLALFDPPAGSVAAPAGSTSAGRGEQGTLAARHPISLSGDGWAQAVGSDIEQLALQQGWPAPVFGAGLAQGGGAADASSADSRGAAANEPGDPIGPGSALGVLLVTGDANLSATGTVTYRTGDRLVAFGHPFFQAGPVELPMTTAYIHDVIASINSSFKLGTPGRIVGTIRQDLRAGVTGILGQEPPMLPVVVRFAGPGGEDVYRYRIARGTALEPSLLGWTVTNSFLQHGWRMGEVGADAHLRIRYNREKTLERRDRIATDAPATDLAGRILTPVAMLIANPHERVVLDSVEVVVRYEARKNEVILMDLWSERGRVSPGETVRIKARTKDRYGAERELPIDIAIPERWRDMSLLIIAGGASELTEWDRDRAPALYDPHDLAGLERLLREYPDDGDLLVRVYAEDEGVVLGDREIGPLPRSVERVLGAGHKRGPAVDVPNYRLLEKRIDVGGPVSGGLGVNVRVE